jgi:hypothetical protein
MYRRIFLITLVIVSMFVVYNLTRPSDKAPLNIQKELENSQSIETSVQTTTAEQQIHQGQIIPETSDTTADLSTKDVLNMIENEVVNAKTALAASNSQEERIELDTFINAAEDILNIQNFSKQDCEKYKADFSLKFHPNDEEPMSEGTEKAYHMLEELCR